MKKIFFFLLIYCSHACAQYKGSLWVFGDSAGIDFSIPSIPSTFSSAMDYRGSCVSIADTNYNMLFYGATRTGNPGNTGYLWDKNNNPLLNGDSLVGGGWYREMIIVPYPNAKDSFYVFSVGVTGSFHYGLYYSIVDMTQDGGLGAVVVKNVQLSNFQALDGLAAIKHGNGRDWWLIFKPAGPSYTPDNNFYLYLITPTGIASPIIQSTGEIIVTNGGNIVFSKSGKKILVTNWDNLIEIFDFDRCTGILSNTNVIEPENVGQAGIHLGSAFSPSEQIVYVTHIPWFVTDTIYYVYQYDLNATDIAASRDTIFTDYYPNMTAQMRLAPDDKIYVTTWYNCDGYCFPYPDSVYNNINMNLSVINSPDSLGSACTYSPYSFYLGGKRAYVGLPNNPDYEMGPLIGSGCDSLVGVQSIKYEVPRQELHVFYHSGWQVAFVNAMGLTGRNYTLNIYDLSGREVFRESGKLASSYFTKDLSCEEFANGMYLVSLRTEKEVLSKKFIKQ